MSRDTRLTKLDHSDLSLRQTGKLVQNDIFMQIGVVSDIVLIIIVILV